MSFLNDNRRPIGQATNQVFSIPRTESDLIEMHVGEIDLSVFDTPKSNMTRMEVDEISLSEISTAYGSTVSDGATGITEILYPDIKSDADSLSQFHSQIPSLVKRDWANTSGMRTLRVAKVLEARGNRPQKHSGLCLIQVSEGMSSLQTFTSSPKFANTMRHIQPLAAGPSDGKLYQSAGEGSAVDLLAQSSFVQVFQIRSHQGTAGQRTRQSDETEYNIQKDASAGIAQAWSRLTNSIQEAADEASSFQLTGQEQPKFFCANGMVESADGIFLGLIGWETLNNMQAVTSDSQVELALDVFMNPEKGVAGEVSITSLELDGFSQ